MMHVVQKHEMDGGCEPNERRADVRLLQWSGHVDDLTIPDYTSEPREPTLPDDHPDLIGMPAWSDGLDESAPVGANAGNVLRQDFTKSCPSDSDALGGGFLPWPTAKPDRFSVHPFLGEAVTTEAPSVTSADADTVWSRLGITGDDESDGESSVHDLTITPVGVSRPHGHAVPALRKERKVRFEVDEVHRRSETG